MVAHVHYRKPRCLLKAYDRGHGPSLEPEDLQAWFDWEEEAFRYRVDSDVSREKLAALIEGSTVEIVGDEHRAVHSTAGDARALRSVGRGSPCSSAGAGAG